jgi:hypothetical protein
MGLKSKSKKICFFFIFLLTFFKRFNSQRKEKPVYIEILDFPPNRRLLFLVRFITGNDYSCYVHIPLRLFFAMDYPGLIICKEKRAIMAMPSDMKKCSIIISDRIENISNSLLNEKKYFHLQYDIFKEEKIKAFYYPISFHPNFQFKHTENYLLSMADNNERKIAALFIGSLDNNYRRDITKDYFKINTRDETFSYVIEHLDPSCLITPQSYTEMKEMMDSGLLKNKVVVIDRLKFSIEGNEYLNVLAQSNFFIYMSGSIFPYCHNHIESIAAGAIPITQFPYLFTPGYEHEKNALIYRELPELITILEKVCGNRYASLTATMRRNIIAYYKEHLGFDSFNEVLKQNSIKNIVICAGVYSMTRKP